MSGGRACICHERKAPLTVPEGANDRPRQWVILKYKHNRSAFNGYHYTPSDYSSIMCRVCGSAWRTKSKLVDSLRQCEDPFAPAVEPIARD